MSPNLCPISNCKVLKSDYHVMCRRHWRMIPRILQDQIWHLYYDSPGSPDHLTAIKEAIGAVEDKEGARAAS